MAGFIWKDEQFGVSFTRMNKNIWPQYRKYLDSIDVWCYSEKSLFFPEHTS